MGVINIINRVFNIFNSIVNYTKSIKRFTINIVQNTKNKNEKLAKNEIRNKKMKRRVVILLKGVNRQVVEVSQPESVYFERILFFVKPEYYGLGEAKLKEKASACVGETIRPPMSKREKKYRKGLAMVLSAAGGAAVTALAALLMQVAA